MTAIVLALGWMLGLVVADTLAPPLPVLLAACACGLGGALLWRQPWYRLALLGMGCAALAGLRYQIAQPAVSAHSIWRWNGRGDLAVVGVVDTDPKRTEEGQQIILDARQVGVDGKSWPAEGQVLVTLPPYPVYYYGQRLLLLGSLKAPAPPKRPTDFDYRKYLERKAIFTLMAEPEVRVLPGQFGNLALAALMSFRDHCREVLLHILPEPQASLAVGILLGLQASIPDQIYANFSTTGTSHILVISGWNITIIGAALYGLFEQLKLSRRAAFWAILACIWIYTLFVGASATVIRAAVMGSLSVAAQRLERPAHAWTTLLVAAWGMTVVAPQTLWDLGFQLSSLATASLFAFGKPVERGLVRLPLLSHPWLGWALEALTATLAAQVLALPIMLYHFGNLSLVAPIANVILLPVVPYAMLFGAIALLVGLLWLPLGQGLALLAWLPLTWLTEGTALFAAMPMAAIDLPRFPLWLLLAYYGAVVAGWLTRILQVHGKVDQYKEVI